MESVAKYEVDKVKLRGGITYYEGLPYLLSVDETAAILNVAPNTARAIMRTKDYPMVFNGNRMLTITHLLPKYLEDKLGADLLGD